MSEVEAVNSKDVLSDLSSVITAAHELKAPLSLIRQLALFLEAEDMKLSERKRLLRQIILTSERALRLTTDITRESRLEDGLFELEPLNPRQICEDVAHEMTPLYRAKGREIRVASAYRPTLVVANRDLLRRILLNFSDNALHFAEANTPVDLRVQVRHSASVRLGVRDYGPAIPVKTWYKLRQNLGTDKQTLHARPQSSGLGLYIAEQFARAMYGHIGAIRHRDGATFYVDLTASSQLKLL